MIEVVDTSALILARDHPVLAAWVRERGEDIAILDIVALEYLMGARTAGDYARLEAALRAFPAIATEATDWARAREVHRSLAEQGPGHQRSVRIPDLVIAATAERTGLVVAHYDEDYDRIAAITGQPTRWVVPRGSV